MDKGIENLKTAQQQLKTYRQSVLKWGFEGKLTNKNVKEGELPEGWKRKELGFLLSFIGSGVTPKGGQDVYQKSGVLFIRSQNVYPDRLYIEDAAYISDFQDEKMKRSRVLSGDVLLNITGASIGRCNYVPDNFPRANVNQHVCILRSDQKTILSKYLASYLNSPEIQSLILNMQAGATRQGLNYNQIRSISIAFPKLIEQEKILREIESRLTVSDKMEESINQSLQQAEALRQSILKKAFEGELI